MKTLRVFHIIHWNEKCLEIYDNETMKGQLYSLLCQPGDGLSHIMPTVIEECHLTSGVRNSFLVATLTKGDGTLVELWCSMPMPVMSPVPRTNPRDSQSAGLILISLPSQRHRKLRNT